MAKRLEFELYDKLTPEQRTHLRDFQLIYSIKNSTEKTFTEEEQERLFVIIDYACSENQTDTDMITISDEIVKAYADGEVTLDTLEKATATEILDAAIGIGCFDSLEEELNEEEEDIE